MYSIGPASPGYEIKYSVHTCTDTGSIIHKYTTPWQYYRILVFPDLIKQELDNIKEVSPGYEENVVFWHYQAF